MVPAPEIILRLLLGAFIGGIVGFEREIHGRAAGFRTQLIVCVAAVLIMIISENYYFRIHSIDASLRIDPARIAASALIGIGFLGAGVIIKSGYAVRGLTTAATIWIVSVIGLAIGAGFYLEGIITSVITIVTLMVLRTVENKIRVLRFRIVSVSTSVEESSYEQDLVTAIKEQGCTIHHINYKKDSLKDEILYTFNISSRDSDAARKIFLALSSMSFTKTVATSE